MTEISGFWDGETLGDSGPYSADTWSNFWSAMFLYNYASEAPIAGYLDELEVDNPSGQTIRLASGLALVQGTFYVNDAAISLAGAIPTPGNVNYYRVILRKDWSAQTIRAILLGPSIVTYPSLTQTINTTFEVSLAKVSIDDGGVVTVTDERDFASAPISRIVDYRQGGSETDWSAQGSSNYQVPFTQVLAGVAQSSAVGGNGSVAVTFPNNGFKFPPTIVTQCYYADSDIVYVCILTSITNTTFAGKVLKGNDTLTNGIDVHWVAYGVPYEAVEVILGIAQLTAQGQDLTVST